LGFALILPLVFGLSFQTPLIMLAVERIGLVTAQDFRDYRRYAAFALAFVSAVLTPTPDVVTMLWLFVPMYGLYELGILVCAWAARNDSNIDAPNPEEPVGV
jgi:sec-independent protein translocase protein TatC